MDDPGGRLRLLARDLASELKCYPPCKARTPRGIAGTRHPGGGTVRLIFSESNSRYKEKKRENECDQDFHVLSLSVCGA